MNQKSNPHETARPSENPSYPVQLLIRGRSVLVVGGGRIALRKTEGLLAAGALVTVVAPSIDPALVALPVTIERRPYRRGETSHYQLVITCTNDPAVNRHVFLDADAAGVWVNSADDPANCSFILPAVARQGDLTVTVSTNGRSPALATWLRRRFEQEFDHRYEHLLDLLAEVRAEARHERGTSEIPGWNDALDDGLFELVAAGKTECARRRLRLGLGLGSHGAEPAEPVANEPVTVAR